MVSDRVVGITGWCVWYLQCMKGVYCITYGHGYYSHHSPYHAVTHHHHLHGVCGGGVVDAVPVCAGVLVAGGVAGVHVTC